MFVLTSSIDKSHFTDTNVERTLLRSSLSGGAEVLNGPSFSVSFSVLGALARPVSGRGRELADVAAGNEDGGIRSLHRFGLVAAATEGGSA